MLQVDKCTMYTLPPTPFFQMAFGPMEPRTPCDLGGYTDALPLLVISVLENTQSFV